MSILRLPISNIDNSGLKVGTNAGVKATVTGVTGKKLKFVRVAGVSDKNTYLELRTTQTGTIATTATSTAVVGTNTLFTSELVAGDKIRVTSNNELLTVATVTDDTNIVLSAAASNTVASSAYELVREKTYALANTTIDNGNNIEVVEGLSGKDVHAFITDSTSNCYLTLYAGYSS